jgi:hypothetical protein
MATARALQPPIPGRPRTFPFSPRFNAENYRAERACFHLKSRGKRSMNKRNPYAALKAAFDADVDRLGGVVVAASKTRVGQALISRYSSISDQNATTHVPADVLLDITLELVRRGGAPETLQVLADLAGFKLVPRAEADAVAPVPITKHIADIIGATSDLMGHAAEATADGRFDDAEKQEADALASQIEQQVAEFREAIRPLSGQKGAQVVSITDRGAA